MRACVLPLVAASACHLLMMTVLDEQIGNKGWDISRQTGKVRVVDEKTNTTECNTENQTYTWFSHIGREYAELPRRTHVCCGNGRRIDKCPKAMLDKLSSFLLVGSLGGGDIRIACDYTRCQTSTWASASRSWVSCGFGALLLLYEFCAGVYNEDENM